MTVGHQLDLRDGAINRRKLRDTALALPARDEQYCTDSLLFAVIVSEVEAASFTTCIQAAQLTSAFGWYVRGAWVNREREQIRLKSAGGDRLACRPRRWRGR
jgi:hypothetical protein